MNFAHNASPDTNESETHENANYEVDQHRDGKKSWGELAKNKEQVLREAFDRFTAAASSEKLLMGRLFSTNDFVSSSPLLRKNASDLTSPETLAERTKGLIDR